MKTATKEDSSRFMKYDKSYHPNHGKAWTTEEVNYLIKFYKYDGLRSISFGLGRTETCVQQKILMLRKRGVIFE